MAQKILFQTKLTDTKSSDVEGVGNLRSDEKGNVYKWVKNTHSTTSTIYGACVYSGATRSEVTKAVTLVTSPTCYTNVAGFWKAAVKTGEYGWIQCKGAATCIIAASIARVMGVLFGIEDALETLTSVVASTQASDGTFAQRSGMIYPPTSAASVSVTATATMAIDLML